MLGAATGVLSAVARPALPRPALAGALLQLVSAGPSIAVPVALHAALRPGAAALVDDLGAVTWRELDERTNRAGQAFLDRVDVSDAPVAFLLRNGREAVECYTACARAGLTALPLNTWAKPDEVRGVLASHRPGLLVAADEFADAAASAACEILWVDGDASYEAALAAASSRPPGPRGRPRVITLTSGTTGQPKGAKRTLSGGSVAPLLGFLDRVPLRGTDTFLIAPPLFHAFAQGMLGIGLALGTTLALPSRFDPVETVAWMRDLEVRAAALVPVMLQRILDVEGLAALRLRVVVVSGSALSEALREEAAGQLGPVVYDLYGSTEVGWAAIATPEDQRRRPGTVGRPGMGMRAFAIGEGGVRLPPGETGEIHVATGWEFEGYTGHGEAPRAVDGALPTGDLGYTDGDGYLYITGRADDMVIVGGENVYPVEVEEVLARHPGLAEVAVVGQEHSEYGQVLVAYAVPASGAQVDGDEVIAFARERMASYKAPKQVTFVETLPRNAVGKVVRRRLG